MAENPPPLQTLESDPIRYWCYHCDKRVSVETLPDLICLECRNGFVESMSGRSPSPPPLHHNSSFNQQFLRVLRLFSNAARDQEDHLDPILDPSGSDNFLRIEFEDWENNNEEEEEEEEEENDEEDGVFEGYEEDQTRSEINENQQGEEHGERNRTRQLDVFRLLRIRISEIHNAIELRAEIPNDFVGNPEDYVDAERYEVLLQDFLENEGGTRRGAPPAARSVVSALPTVQIAQISEGEGLICAVCKESVSDGGLLKKLSCEHIYHEDCIIPWLDSRNSCPICRFELPTDDADYEEQKKKKRPGSYSGEGNSII